MELSNRQTIARLGTLEVHGLGVVRSPDPADLARAGEALPWRGWLGEALPWGDRPGTAQPARAAATTASLTAASSSASITYGGIV